SEEARRAVCAIFGLPAPEPCAAPAIPGRHPNTAPFAVELARLVGQHHKGEALAALTGAGVPCCEVRPPDSETFLDDPNTVANNMAAVCQHPRAGRLRVAWQFVQFADTHASAGRPTPLLGEHTTQVLREVGYSEGEIRSLHAERIVKTETA